jgi:hypothetical protein
MLRNGPLSVRLVPQILAIRAGIGMIHFVYSARVWKLSDPQVRETIGADLFRAHKIPALPQAEVSAVALRIDTEIYSWSAFLLPSPAQRVFPAAQAQTGWPGAGRQRTF